MPSFETQIAKQAATAIADTSVGERLLQAAQGSGELSSAVRTARDFFVQKTGWKLDNSTFAVMNSDDGAFIARAQTTHLTKQGQPEGKFSLIGKAQNHITIDDSDLPKLNQWLQQERAGFGSSVLPGQLSDAMRQTRDLLEQQHKWRIDEPSITSISPEPELWAGKAQAYLVGSHDTPFAFLAGYKAQRLMTFDNRELRIVREWVKRETEQL